MGEGTLEIKLACAIELTDCGSTDGFVDELWAMHTQNKMAGGAQEGFSPD